MPSDSPATILVVDDEDDILDLLTYNLQGEGFVVVVARDGVECLEVAGQSNPDLIILDIMMPRMDGLEACAQLRKHPDLSSTPILMLTARSEEPDHIVGLDTGADIYMSKPISVPVLLSQVKAMLRGSDREERAHDLIRIHDLEIDRDRYEVRRTGTDPAVLKFPRKEFELLSFLANRPGRVFSRSELLDRVWGQDVFVVDRTIDVHVRKIREKIGEDYIETVKGVGYRFRDQRQE